MQAKKTQNVMNGAFILVISTVIVKVIGLMYKIPLTAFIGEVGRGYFNAAYNIYTPIFAVSMAGLPVALSTMVSRCVALEKYRQARKTFRVALSLFVFTGILGTLALILLAYPYSVYLIQSRQTLMSIICIAPSVFFCCVMAAYRGYYEGLCNMTPTAVSQIVEALGKTLLGIVSAYAVMKIGVSQIPSGTVFSVAVENEAQGFSVIYPYSAAAAVFGVTVGTVAGLLYLVVLKKVKGDGFTREDIIMSPKAESGRAIAKELIKTAIPVVVSSLILNVTNLIDTATIQNRLVSAIGRNIDIIKQMYIEALTLSDTLDGDLSVYLYGVYGAVLDFRSLVPTVTMTLGVSAIPALSAAWARKDVCRVRQTVNTVIKATMLIALPAGFGMAVLSDEILFLIYGGTRSASLVGVAAPLLTVYGFATPLMAVSAPLTNMLQAIGRADIPVKALFVGSLIKIVSNYILVGEPMLNIKGAPIGSVLCYVTVVFYELAAILKITGVSLDINDVFFKPFFCACVISAAAFYLDRLLSQYINIRLSTLICVLFSSILYIILLFLTKNVTKNDIFLLPGGEKFVKLLEKT